MEAPTTPTVLDSPTSGCSSPDVADLQDSTDKVDGLSAEQLGRALRSGVDAEMFSAPPSAPAADESSTRAADHRGHGNILDALWSSDDDGHGLQMQVHQALVNLSPSQVAGNLQAAPAAVQPPQGLAPQELMQSEPNNNWGWMPAGSAGLMLDKQGTPAMHTASPQWQLAESCPWTATGRSSLLAAQSALDASMFHGAREIVPAPSPEQCKWVPAEGYAAPPGTRLFRFDPTNNRDVTLRERELWVQMARVGLYVDKLYVDTAWAAIATCRACVCVSTPGVRTPYGTLNAYFGTDNRLKIIPVRDHGIYEILCRVFPAYARPGSKAT
ncbi:unnamed protein product [Polarella glacialis]|uniref:Uncharacterized protein n=1 Tax=Polarella glacialis TaxID=89957 RepID=A0A813L166_POLGL|nr:unnamed protein product [Polarella glacialis]